MATDPYPNLDDDGLADQLVARGSLPRHIAIIMDGNGRWARRRVLPRAAGHRAGRHAVRAVVRACSRLGVEVLTLYTFSHENFARPPAEVRALWSFLEEALHVEREELRRRGVRLLVSGEVDLLPEQPRRVLLEAMAFLDGGKGLTLNLALAYGGRQEIVRAARLAARRVAAGELAPEALDEADLRQGLYHPELPDPDLIIRTSGEQRLSNFLVWQAAYAELYITPVLWPDFRERHLMLAVDDYLSRERRFGAVSPGDRDGAGEPAADVWDAERWKKLLKVRP